MTKTKLLMAGLVASIGLSVSPLSAEETLVGAAAGFDELTSVQRDALVIQADAAIVYHSTLGWQYTADGGESYLPLADAVAAEFLSEDIGDYLEEDAPTTSADFVLVYDSSEGEWVKTLIEDLGMGGGGGGDVTSVNGATGVVVLDPDDLDDASTTHKFTSATEISKLSGIETGATADQSDAEIATAFTNEVPQATTLELETGTETDPRQLSPADLVTAIDEHAAGGGGSFDISDLTDETAFDTTADDLTFYDATAAAMRKIEGRYLGGGLISSAASVSDANVLGTMEVLGSASGSNASGRVTLLQLWRELALGSDATGDLYYRNASGDLTRLPKGTSGQVLTQGATIPAWQDASSGFDIEDYLAPQTLTDAATITYDVDAGVSAIVTLGGDRTLDEIADAVAGQTGTLTIIQDGTGGRALTLDASQVDMTGNIDAIGDMAAGEVAKIAWETHNGTDFYLWTTIEP